MESAITAPVSGHIKRVAVQEGDAPLTFAYFSGTGLTRSIVTGDSINQGDLTVEIVH